MQQRLPAYLARIGLGVSPSADLAGLRAIQFAHRQSIAFENLDIPLGRGIAIDSNSVFAKLVERRRGGYCFEQNRLFADALTALGFANRPLMARVMLGPHGDAVPARTHVLLLVTMDGEAWIADAGFGGSFTPPLPLTEGAAARAPDGEDHRLRRIGTPGSLPGEWLLERRAVGGVWQPQYCFDLAEVAPVDLALGNLWTSTMPGTRFTTLCVVSIILRNGFATLTEGHLRVSHAGDVRERMIESADDYRDVLKRQFGLCLTEEEIAGLPMFKRES